MATKTAVPETKKKIVKRIVKVVKKTTKPKDEEESVLDFSGEVPLPPPARVVSLSSTPADESSEAESGEEDENPFSFFKPAQKKEPKPVKPKTKETDEAEAKGNPFSFFQFSTTGSAPPSPPLVPPPIHGTSNQDDDDDIFDDDDDDDDDDDEEVPLQVHHPKPVQKTPFPFVPVPLSAKHTNDSEDFDDDDDDDDEEDDGGEWKAKYTKTKKELDLAKAQIVVLKEKEKKDNQQMEAVLQQLEANLQQSRQVYERNLAKLRTELENTKKELHLARSQRSDSEYHQIFSSTSMHAQRTSDNLASLAGNAEAQLKSLLSGCEALREIARTISAIDKFGPPRNVQ
eukprot:TRINITY_DN2031_c0_g1_i1.p1 TRINITY_DN2031_c0_g1~~TRINITY_DN2031_c0_g1_i1.p1  ORF type:complete len:343 (+),score=169.49 TRINITY_DN2031_c0_g1_i1:62-1090(+)